MEMPDLLITRSLPNPVGKDRTPANRVTNAQLNNEWIEFRNDTANRLNIEEVTLHHTTFNDRCERTGERLLMQFRGVLAVGQSLRIHTGTGTAWDEGTIRHLYADRTNFVWNNVCGDTAVLRLANGDRHDWASYDGNPPEGVVLERVPNTNRLAVTVLAGRR
jgi:hypothetical protein